MAIVNTVKEIPIIYIITCTKIFPSRKNMILKEKHDFQIHNNCKNRNRQKR